MKILSIFTGSTQIKLDLSSFYVRHITLIVGCHMCLIWCEQKLLQKIENWLFFHHFQLPLRQFFVSLNRLTSIKKLVEWTSIDSEIQCDCAGGTVISR